MLDITRPLKLADGRKVSNVKLWEINIEDPLIEAQVEGDVEADRLFDLDGTHRFKELPDLVYDDAIDWSKPIRLKDQPNRKVRVLTQDLADPTGPTVVVAMSNTKGDWESLIRINPANPTSTGWEFENVPERVVNYFKTSPQHSCWASIVNANLRLTFENGKLISAEVLTS